eukprot:Phypoly_transcript_01656.p1 GENE.Phypoly_transcript_01656~~Phypoly_transcript_01656.p1  ORF type:complete len:1049 (+),score=208.79 Phypoly_transcript_01656:48-3194(+)
MSFFDYKHMHFLSLLRQRTKKREKKERKDRKCHPQRARITEGGNRGRAGGVIMLWYLNFIRSLFQVVFQGQHMFWRIFVRDSPLLDSALEGIVFKEGKGRFIGKFRKKRLLAYDEVAKCLRYYTPQRALKGTIYLHDILFITPGRSAGRDLRKDDVFEITIPGRVYVFHVHNVRETRKWIGILSRELDLLKIRDRIQLNNGNLGEATYSKTLRPNSAILSSLRIGDHREHEECCFLFDEEHQHKIIALESLCSLQAMKIYELSHNVDKYQRKCEELEVPPSEEIRRLKDQYHRLSVGFEMEKVKVLKLQAEIEEEEVKKAQEQDKNLVRKVEKSHEAVAAVKVMRVEKGDASKTTPNAAQKKAMPTAPSFVNLPSDRNRMEEIRKLQDELEQTKTLLALERARALENPFQLANFNSPSPLPFDSTRNYITTTTTTTTSSSSNPPRSPSVLSRDRAFTTSHTNLSKLQSIPENTSIHNPKLHTNSYKTFAPSVMTNAYLDFHTNNLNSQRTPSPKQSISLPPSPQTQRPQTFRQNGNENSQILSPVPQYPPQSLLLDPVLQPTIANPLATNLAGSTSSLASSTNSLTSNTQSGNSQSGSSQSGTLSSNIQQDLPLSPNTQYSDLIASNIEALSQSGNSLTSNTQSSHSPAPNTPAPVRTPSPNTQSGNPLATSAKFGGNLLAISTQVNHSPAPAPVRTPSPNTQSGKSIYTQVNHSSAPAPVRTPSPNAQSGNSLAINTQVNHTPAPAPNTPLPTKLTKSAPFTDVVPTPSPKQPNGLRGSTGTMPKGLAQDFNVVSSVTSTNTSIFKTVKQSTVNSANSALVTDFNIRQDTTPVTKQRSFSESSTAPILFHAAPNGKVGSLRAIPELVSPRSRTNSNPTPMKINTVSSSTISSTSTTTTLSSKFGPEFAELLSSHPDDNGWAVQVVAKLNEAIAEIATLSTQLVGEREKVKSLMEEKDHMLETMEDMTRERAKNQKFRDDMEDLMEATEGKLNTMREALEIEIQLRMASEAKLAQLAQAQAALQQSILEDEMPTKPEILQPLLTNYSH